MTTCKHAERMEQERNYWAEFEVWARSRGYRADELARSKIGIINPAYYNAVTEEAWAAWQAAQASQVVSIKNKEVFRTEPGQGFLQASDIELS